MAENIEEGRSQFSSMKRVEVFPCQQVGPLERYNFLLVSKGRRVKTVSVEDVN
jgi:hypothetical protein